LHSQYSDVTVVESKRSNLTKASAFRLFKITIFWVLMINLVYYMYEDVTAYLYQTSESTFLDKVEAFAISIDYVAWMVLIVLFEMETSAQSRDRFTGARRWVIAGLTAVCYGFLVYADYGYVVALEDAYNYEPIESRPACYFANTNFAYLDSTARPIELTHLNCSEFAGKAIFKSPPPDNLIATEASLRSLQKLSWVDVLNASAWLLVVLLFQIEVSLEQMKKLTNRRLKIVMVWKGLAYLVLLCNAVYWTVFGKFIDYWDAWLWLLAFILIDLNMLGLDETQNQKASDRLAEG
jgi:hypothetical protein